MRRRARTIAIAAFLGFAAFRGIAADDPLTLSASGWDFGTVSQSDRPGMTLTVANRSTSSITVTLIPTCDCLSVDPSRRAVAPGAAASFRIEFDPSGEEGEVSRTLVIATDIPGRPRTLFTVTGTVTGGGGEGGSAGGSPATAASTAGGPGRVAITYWYTPGCRSCERFLAEEVPRLARERSIAIDVTRRDLLAPGAYEEYAQAVAARGATVHGIPGLLVGDGVLLQGEEEIRGGLAAALDAASAGTAAAVPAGPPGPAGRAALALLPVLAGGLLDGINPCAFTTLIFLLASLALAGRGRREVLLLGAAFTLAVFATYFAVGLGLLAALRAAVAFPVVSRVLRWLLVAVLAVFAALSARDAALAARGRASEMTLQLPGALKRRIHASIRTGVRSAALAASALGLGFLVSVFEFACTGQVYLPTLAYLARLHDARAVPLLVVYNLGFIAPLVAVFAASWIGVTSRGLGAFFQRHLVAVKVALALFFAALAALTLAT